METEEGYDVLKFIDRGGRCYVSTDYIRGDTLAGLLGRGQRIEKETLWKWLEDMLRSLKSFQKCTDTAYQYVNPYSFIAASEGKELYLLDVGSKNQEKLLKKMQKKSVRESFLSPDNLYYQKSGKETDVYGLGRTWQYMFAVADIGPPLTGGEKKKLRKIISRCLEKPAGNQSRTIEEISEQFSKLKRKRKIKKRKRCKKFFQTAAAVCLLTACFFLFAGRDKAELREGKEEVKERESAKEEGVIKEKEALFFQMGMSYFLELRDYEKSGELFGKLKDKDELAEYYYTLSSYLMEGRKGTAEPEVQRVLERIEELSLKEGEDRGVERRDYDRSLLRGYAVLEDAKSAHKVIRIGERYMKESVGEEGEQREEWEIRNCLARAYEEIGEYEKAVSQYESLLEGEAENEKKEEIYKKLSSLYDEMGETDKAWAVLGQGIEKIEASDSLRLEYIRMQCKDISVDREICAAVISNMLKESPGLSQKEEFVKLQKEYEIKIEGGQVWVGR